MPKTIVQSVTFKGVSPETVYEMLMDSKVHSRCTGATARISRKPGGRFTAYDGYIEGVHVTLLPAKKIVQLWRGSDWPEGHYARTTFLFTKTTTGTRLRFRQSNVPDHFYESIRKGWIEFYWKPMSDFFGKGDR